MIWRSHEISFKTHSPTHSSVSKYPGHTLRYAQDVHWGTEQTRWPLHSRGANSLVKETRLRHTQILTNCAKCYKGKDQETIKENGRFFWRIWEVLCEEVTFKQRAGRWDIQSMCMWPTYAQTLGRGHQEWRVKEPTFLTKETRKASLDRRELGEFKELKKGQ